MKYPIILSCEHAGKNIPTAYQNLFAQAHEVLSTHRGWDIGALPMAQTLAERLQVPLYFEETSRLLIEMNRSEDNPALFSEFTHSLDEDIRQQLIQEIYLPYRNRVVTALKEAMAAHTQVLHFSVHTFTPVFDEEMRTTDIGLLFDPERTGEVRLCRYLHQYLSNHLPGMQVDDNKPYQGTDDGFSTFLRTHFPENQYLGIEIEINQKYAGSDKAIEITKILSDGLRNFYEGN